MKPYAVLSGCPVLGTEMTIKTFKLLKGQCHKKWGNGNCGSIKQVQIREPGMQ